MDNQVLKKGNWVSQVALIVVACVAIAVLILLGFRQLQFSDPYVRTVLSLTGDRVQGQAIFQMNCAGCHGVQADGRVGPSLLDVSSRKSRISLIHQVISGKTPPMPQFQPSAQEMADLLSYLQSL
ncbi:MAG: c-type cytochrome [Leptodesmis sp.]|uniref:c-type cytochrome n=1 Tax=Leptodesmis sp. TaxID=3100501 RepID=UPI003D1143AE